jgi:YjgF/chorismate_mutase-like, putative endoribonuclease/Amidase
MESRSTKGKLGRQVTVEEGQAAARTCAINLLAQVKVALGDLDHVVRVVRLGGFMVPMRGYNPPPFPPLSGHGDLAVVGPMTRTAADLALALDVVAGPDEEHAGIGYRLALPPARHNNLKSFRVLVIYSHPLMPTGTAVRTAIGRLSERLAKAGGQGRSRQQIATGPRGLGAALYEALGVRQECEFGA